MSQILYLIAIAIIADYTQPFRQRFYRKVSEKFKRSKPEEEQSRPPQFFNAEISPAAQYHIESLVCELTGKVFQMQKGKRKNLWNSLDVAYPTLPVDGEEVICYIPAWESRIVAYARQDDGEVAWIFDGEELLKRNYPSRWLAIEDPAS